MIKSKISAVMFALLLSACATTKKDLSKLQNADVRSILIVPPVNSSVEVTASEYFLSTLPIPVAESGYYVFPVNLVKRLLEDEGLSDASLVQNAAPQKLGALFGADAILYSNIEKWTAKYAVLSTSVEVKIHFILKDARSGEILWEDVREKSYVPPNSSGGSPLAALITAAVQAAMTKAAPNYVPIARLVNAEAFEYPGAGLLPGPYKVARKAAKQYP